MTACKWTSSTEPRDLPGEMWRAVVDYEGHYEVSNLGRIRSIKRAVAHLMTPKPSTNQAYPEVQLWRNNKKQTRLVHREVAKAFLGPYPEGMEVCHSDGDKWNSALSNLRYDTRSANVLDQVRHGTHNNITLSEVCGRGHEWTPENTHLRTRNGRVKRHCRACAAIRRREDRRRAKESA